jgi:hypothetical protein
MKEQIQKIKIARARLVAEIQVAQAMLPDDCASELHYNGPRRAIAAYPEFKELITAMEDVK